MECERGTKNEVTIAIRSQSVRRAVLHLQIEIQRYALQIGEVVFKIIVQAVTWGLGGEICSRIYTEGKSQKETVVLARQAPALSPLKGHH